MRYTIGDLRRHHRWEDVAAWWLELPGRRLRWWRWLLLEEGRGWLRWKPVSIEGGFHLTEYGYEPDDFQWFAPPAHRLWMMARMRDRSVWDWAADHERSPWS